MAKISLKEMCLFLFPFKQVALPFHELSSGPCVSANAAHVPGLNTAQQRDFNSCFSLSMVISVRLLESSYTREAFAPVVINYSTC